MPNLSDEDRFWQRVSKDPDGCWRWTASGVRDYGRLLFNGKRVLAHRLSWELHNGPIPAGKEVCHNCPGGDDPRCVNPAHLFLGTHAENMADMTSKGRHRVGHTRRGEAAPGAKLTDATAAEALSRYRAGGESHATLAAAYGVSSAAIQQLVERKTWRHLDHSP